MEEERSIKVLYIEDDTDLVNLVSLILDDPKFQIQTAQSGRTGLEIAFLTPPDLILLDLMMPDLDGWGVYQQLKSNDLTRNIPVIVITAKSQPIDRILGLKIARVDDYLTKPFRPQDLINSINLVFDRLGRPLTRLASSV